MEGWLSDYQIAHGFSNPGQLKVLIKTLSELDSSYTELIEPLKGSLNEIYEDYTIYVHSTLYVVQCTLYIYYNIFYVVLLEILNQTYLQFFMYF